MSHLLERFDVVVSLVHTDAPGAPDWPEDPYRPVSMKGVDGLKSFVGNEYLQPSSTLVASVALRALNTLVVPLMAEAFTVHLLPALYPGVGDSGSGRYPGFDKLFADLSHDPLASYLAADTNAMETMADAMLGAIAGSVPADAAGTLVIAGHSVPNQAMLWRLAPDSLKSVLADMAVTKGDLVALTPKGVEHLDSLGD
ncbi:MAG: hypothetical protein AAF799_25895 [Myxococcota bacterium]